MIDAAVAIGFVLVGLAILLNGWRLLLGPTRGDRILALDTMVINTIALIPSTSVRWLSLGTRF